MGEGIGLAVGLITSFIIHREVEDPRSNTQGDLFEMNFGDLPPSPFVVPKLNLKRGMK